jgi:hypothetical protein
LAAESAFDLLLAPAARRVFADAHDAAPGLIQPFGQSWDPVLTRDEDPLVEPDLELGMVFETLGQLPDQVGVTMRVAQKGIKGPLIEHGASGEKETWGEPQGNSPPRRALGADGHVFPT